MLSMSMMKLSRLMMSPMVMTVLSRICRKRVVFWFCSCWSCIWYPYCWRYGSMGWSGCCVVLMTRRLGWFFSFGANFWLVNVMNCCGTSMALMRFETPTTFAWKVCLCPFPWILMLI